MSNLRTNGREAGSAGFSLTEVMVMSALLAFALLSVATLFVFSIKHDAWGRDETVIATLAQRKMEQLRRISPNKLYTDPWTNALLARFDASGANGSGPWRCLSDPRPTQRDSWPVIGLPVSDVHWTPSEYANDDLKESQFRWNYCVYPVTFGNCRPDASPPTTCGPDFAGMYVDGRKVVVEVCRRREHNREQKTGRAPHCAKVEMYR